MDISSLTPNPRARPVRDNFYRPLDWLSVTTGHPALMANWRWQFDAKGESTTCMACFPDGLKKKSEPFCLGCTHRLGFAPTAARCDSCLMPFGCAYDVGRWAEQDDDRNDLCVVCALRERFTSLDEVIAAAARLNAPLMRRTATLELTLERRGKRTRQDTIRRVADGGWGNASVFSLLKTRTVTVRQAGLVIVRLAQRIIAEMGEARKRSGVVYLDDSLAA